MFRLEPLERGATYRVAVTGLLTLSLAALAVTIWVMVDFLREQEIVSELMEQLPPESAASAEALAGELRWQFRLTILVVLNLVVTGFAVALLSRAYQSSQESLRDIKAQTGDILKSVDQAIITTDLNGDVTSINRSGLEMLDTSEACIGNPIEELSGGIPLEQFRLEARSDRSSRLNRDFSLSSNGTTRILRAHCHPLKISDDEIAGNIIQLRDVTEQVLMDDRMRRMERYLGLGSLAAGLHHEIKNPLAALSLHVQLLEEELDAEKPTDAIQEMLGVIRTEVARVGGVLESFRDFASRGSLNMAETDLKQLIERQLRLIAPQANRQQIDIRMTASKEPIPQMQVDRVRLEQVLLNLLVNAMDAMPDGGDLTVRLARGLEAGVPTVQISVIDTGPGVSETLRDHIFDPYFTTKNDGTGMGLALCDKIVRQHNGSLDLQSTSAGAVFTITLPVNERGLDESSG